jgi:hypothetical protein
MNLQPSEPNSHHLRVPPRLAPRVVLVAGLGDAYGSRAAAAALACRVAEERTGGLLVDLGGTSPRPTLLSTCGARRLEEAVASTHRHAGSAARGRICHLVLEAGAEGLADATEIIEFANQTVVVHLPFSLLPSAVAGPHGLDPDGVLLRADLKESRWLLAEVARHLMARGLDVAVLKKRLPWVAERRALFGALPPEAPDGLPDRLVRRLLGR